MLEKTKIKKLQTEKSKLKYRLKNAIKETTQKKLTKELNKIDIKLKESKKKEKAETSYYARDIDSFTFLSAKQKKHAKELSMADREKYINRIFNNLAKRVMDKRISEKALEIVYEGGSYALGEAEKTYIKGKRIKNIKAEGVRVIDKSASKQKTELLRGKKAIKEQGKRYMNLLNTSRQKELYIANWIKATKYFRFTKEEKKIIDKVIKIMRSLSPIDLSIAIRSGYMIPIIQFFYDESRSEKELFLKACNSCILGFSNENEGFYKVIKNRRTEKAIELKETEKIIRRMLQ